jgi:hypothetical protein
MLDAFCCTCAQCARSFSWQGGYTAMPPCPHCGWRPPLAELLRFQRMSDLLRGAGGGPGDADEDEVSPWD